MTIQINNLGDLLQNEAVLSVLNTKLGNVDLFPKTAQYVEFLSKISYGIWQDLDEEGKSQFLSLCGIPSDDIATVQKEVALLLKVLNPPTVTVEVEASVAAAKPRSTNPGILQRMKETAGKSSSFAITQEVLLRIQNFTFIYAVYGYEAAQLDNLVLRALANGAGRYINDLWLAELLDKYRSAKESGASSILVSENHALGVSEFHLELVPQVSRVEYWEQVNTVLTESGFYTLIEQLAFWARATGNAEALGKISQVTSTLSDSRYDPKQIEKLHLKVLKAISTFMEDRTRLFRAQNIGKEYDIIIGNALQDEDLLYSLCKPPRSVTSIVDYFWETDQLDLKLERAALQLGVALTQFLENLCRYDQAKSYLDQMELLYESANDAYTLLQEFGTLIPARYRVNQVPEFNNIGSMLTQAITLRVQVSAGGTTTTVEATVAVKGATQEEIKHLLELLETHRTTAFAVSRQLSLFGAAYAPPHTTLQLQHTREEIASLKAQLRALGHTVEDQYIDTDPSRRR